MKKSVLDKLQDFKEVINKPGFNSHFLIGIDVGENGAPHASMMISKGQPFETIGMIDVLMRNLKDIRRTVIDELSQKNNTKNGFKISNEIDEAIQDLPKHIRDKVINLKKRLDIAFEEQDQETLDKIKIELQHLKLDEIGPDSDDDDEGSSFNITDFKGGIA